MSKKRMDKSEEANHFAGEEEGQSSALSQGACQVGGTAAI
jgi:hypothetical protein